jgi:hypothetical protein
MQDADSKSMAASKRVRRGKKSIIGKPTSAMEGNFMLKI